ncbi:MAG: carboxypeptidase regulatory-like domain-containing protein [Pirellulales bacterium]
MNAYSILRTTAVGGLLALCLVGCSSSTRPELAPVRGTVTLDGQPLFPGRIVFIPAAGRASSARIDESGQFELVYLRDVKGAALGEHEVRITNGSGDPPVNTLPARYNTQTTLSAHVEPGENTFDFELTRD